MFIESIRITQFAGLSGLTLDLSDGINVLEGKNESGKSTVAECIRFVLYGFRGKADRERYFGFTAESVSASLILSENGKRYHVERKAVGAKETCTVYDPETGARLYEGAVPGEVFFGIPAGLFASTVFVGQTGGSQIDGRSTAEAVDNLLFSASEGVNIKKALKRLDEAKVDLWHKNRKGGRIFELENRLSELRVRLNDAKTAGAEIMALENELAEMAEQLRAERIKLGEVESRLADYRLLRMRERNRLLDERETTYRHLTEAYRLHRETNTRGGFFPDAAYLDSLKECGAELARCDENIRKIEGDLQKLDRQIETLRAEQEEITRADDEKKARLSFKRGIALAVAILGCILFLAGAAITAVLFMTNRTDTAIPAAAVSVVFLGVMVGGFVLASRYMTAIRALVHESDGREERLLERLEWLGEDLADAKKERDNYKTILDDLSRKWSFVPTAKTLTELKNVLDEDRRLENEQEKARVIYVQMKTDVESSRETDPEDDGREIRLPERFDPKDTERRRTLIAELIRSKEEIYHKRELRLTELNASSEAPAPLLDAIGALETEIQTELRKYQAYALAAERLNAASETMRASVSPRLAKASGELMGAVTDGKYREIGVDGSLSMTFRPRIGEDGDTLAEEVYMSAGTVDAAYVSLRLALASLVCGEHLPPMIFDESFVRLDEERLTNMLRLLSASGGQILLFTSGRREVAVLTEASLPYRTVSIARP